jgi:hypothetical protein
MNSRMISLAVLAVNLGLAGTLIYLIASSRSPAFTAPLRTKYVTNTVTQIAVRKINATNSLLTALAGRPLSWQALESTNYVAYIQNLRAFGCPDETVKDIILTDIARLYAKRRAEIRAQAPQLKFWQTGDPNNTPAGREINGLLKQLDKERDDLVRELLGVNFRTEMGKYYDEDEGAGLNLSFLPQEKQAAVQALHDKYAALEEEIYSRTKGVFLDQDQAEIQRLQKQREAELAQVLSPAELEDYQLRNSETAQNMRSQLAGFEPTEEEFRKIFQLQKTFDDQFNNAFDPTDSVAAALKDKAEFQASEALNEEMRKTLGPERFAQYQRAQDGDYRSLVQVAERFNLPREVAGSVYDMKLVAERQKAQVEANATLSDEQRGRILAAIAKATEQNVAAALGNNVYQSYQKSAGQWLGNLYYVNENNLALPPEPPQPPTVQLPPLPPLPPEIRDFILNKPGGLGNPPVQK